VYQYECGMWNVECGILPAVIKNEIVGFTVAVTFLARGAYFGLDTTHVSDPNTNLDPEPDPDPGF